MSVVADLFRRPTPQATQPTVIAAPVREPAAIPTASDERVQDSLQRRRRLLSARQGRASTILSDRREFQNERLG